MQDRDYYLWMGEAGEIPGFAYEPASSLRQTVSKNICFAAMTQGLGTCVENQAITWQAGIKEHLNLPENARLAILANVQPIVDEINQKLADGATFAELIPQYTTDPGTKEMIEIISENAYSDFALVWAHTTYFKANKGGTLGGFLREEFRTNVSDITTDLNICGATWKDSIADIDKEFQKIGN